MKKRVTLVILLIVISLLLLSSCGADSPKGAVKVFEKAAKIINSNPDMKSYESNKDLDKLLGQLGLSKEYSELKITDAFIEAYLEKHTNDELLNDFIVVYKYVVSHNSILFKSGHDFVNNDKCLCLRLNDALSAVLGRVNYGELRIDAYHKVIGGYYADNIDAKPQSYSEDVKEKFWNQSGTSTWYETRTNTGKADYYGDLAILNEKEYQYSEGMYKWVGGTFYDTLPSWTLVSSSSLYYKGRLILSGESDLSSLKLIPINDSLYVVYQEKVEDEGAKTHHPWIIHKSEVEGEEFSNSVNYIMQGDSEVLEEQYQKAVQLYNEKQYMLARALFSADTEYKDSADYILKCEEGKREQDYQTALSLYTNKEYLEAIEAFKAIQDYKDSKTQIENCKTSLYDLAMSQFNDEKYLDAYNTFNLIYGFKDSVQMAAQATLNYKKQLLMSATIGSTVIFGKYEQDNITENGKEDIEWIVLAKNNNRVLLISRYALDGKAYNNSLSSIKWEACSLRKWLNDTFIDTAFSLSERAVIANTKVIAEKNPEYSTSPGNNTIDQVFILSINEANAYFGSDSARRCKPTAYAIAQGVYDKSGACWWYLRTPNGYSTGSNAAYVDFSGKINGTIFNKGAVRPAIWVTIN